MPKLLILDFDGTMTDAEREGASYRTGYLEDVATLTGHDVDEIMALAARFEAEIMAAPHAHGWRYNGQIVAPAVVDPYLRVMPVARMILDHYGVFRDETDRTRLLDGILYKYNYPKTEIAFRSGAATLLRALRGREAYIVTNSHTEPVQSKVRALSRDGDLDWLIERVHGAARKYAVDVGFEQVPESLTVPGLERPVLLRRQLYCARIESLLEAAGAAWSELLVVGDIFELDLALPLAMGAQVALLVNDFTPDYERAYLEAHPRGHVLEGLDEVAALLVD